MAVVHVAYLCRSIANEDIMSYLCTLHTSVSPMILSFFAAHTQHELSQFFLHARGAGSRHSECIPQHGVGAKISTYGRLNFIILRHLASVCRSKIFGLFADGRTVTLAARRFCISCVVRSKCFLTNRRNLQDRSVPISKRLKYFNAVVASTAYFSSQNNAI